MTDRPRGGPLSTRHRRLFREQFEKDLDFFRLFFLLMNKSCVIRHVSVVWAEGGPARRVGLEGIVGTADAMGTPSAGLLACDTNLNPDFCNIVSGYGRREAESCAISDRAAEQRCRETETTQVYHCHAGLVDIAVPVVCDGQYVATLLCGQALREPPSQEGFVQIRKDVARLQYINLEELEKAYWKVPVVSEEAIQKAAQMLEIFAGYLATSWKRLTELVQDQCRRLRESQLLSKEFAHLILEGSGLDRSALREMMRRLGFTRMPNRMVVVKLETEEDYPGLTLPFDVAFSGALHTIEELCEQEENVAVSYLRKTGVCVFLSEPESSGRAPSSYRCWNLAQRITEAIRQRCPMRVRVGIGGIYQDWASLVDSYHEAWTALLHSPEAIATYRKPAAAVEDLSVFVREACQHLAERRIDEARSALLSLPRSAKRFGHGSDSFRAQQQFFSSAFFLICFTAKRIGADRERIEQILCRANEEILQAANLFGMHGTYLQCAEQVLDEVRKLYSGRRKNIVGRACRMIDESLERSPSQRAISPVAIAARLGISSGHLGRTFRQLMGLTFERYVMVKRVEVAQRLFLDPLNNVSQVAEKCGFSDPTYFARVFRKIAGCSPTEYMDDPLRLPPLLKTVGDGEQTSREASLGKVRG